MAETPKDTKNVYEVAIVIGDIVRVQQLVAESADKAKIKALWLWSQEDAAGEPDDVLVRSFRP